MRTFLMALLGVGLLPFAAGCDSGDPDVELDSSQYTITVDDDAEDTDTPALWASGTTANGDGTALLLGANSSGTFGDDRFVVFVGLDTDLPDTGSYDLVDVTGRVNSGNIVPEGEVAGVFYDPATVDTRLAIYVSESGSLRVTDDEDDELRGSYTLRARRFELNLGTGQWEATSTRATVSGEFRAENDQGILDDVPTLRTLPTSVASR